MQNVYFEGVQIGFKDLSEEMQKKMYLRDEEKFKKEAAKSQYASVRKLVLETVDCDSETLDEVFKEEIEKYKKYENLKVIWNQTNFKKDDEKRKQLAELDNKKIRLLVAEDKESSSEFLNQMFQYEIEHDKEYDVIRAILKNSNFKMDDDTRKALASSDDEDYRIMVARDKETSSEFLNLLLRKEVGDEGDGEVIEAILDNPNFKMDNDTRKLYATSENDEDRRVAAEDEGSSSEFLNQMLRDEIENDEEDTVIYTILDNPNFKMDNDIRKVLAKSENWKYRCIVAKNEGSSSELLNQMLRDEIGHGDDEDVINSIRKNPNFKMDDDTRKALANSDNYGYRIMAVEDEGTTREFLENMYLKEKDEDVLEAIEINLFSKLSKNSITLNVVQKRQILEVLKKVKRLRKRKPLSYYLEEILEIIG